MALIELRNIKKYYTEKVLAFQCDSIVIEKGKKIGIAGETGSGKSTLLKIVAGLEKPDEGEALFHAESIYPKLDRLIPGHPEIAYLSQSFELAKSISVYEFLKTEYSDEEDVNEIATLCRVVELLNKPTRSLSGGEKQRVALAKALLKEPEVLLIDEPYSNLDHHHKRIMREVVEKICKETEATIIMVSHEPTDLLPWADEIMVLKNSEVIQRGTPKEIYNQPQNRYQAGLFGEYVVLHAEHWNLGSGEFIARPEQFSIENEGKGGVIESIKYHGSFEILKVNLGNEKVLVRSMLGIHKVGEKVKIMMNAF